MKFRPLHDRVVIRRLEGEEKTKGGIIIPDTAKEKPQEGEVVAVGPGARDEAGKLIPIDLKAGDRMLFGKWSGTEVKIDGEELLIMKESDVMGVLESTRGRAARPHRPPPISSDRIEENEYGCQGRKIFHRRARQDVARRRYSRQCRQGDARPEGPQRRPRQELWRPPNYQGRRDGRQGNRARGQVREHGRADGARGRVQDQHRRRRRHDHRHGARAGHRQGRRQDGGCRPEPDGPEARHRSRGGRGREEHREPGQEGEVLGGNRPGRHGRGQWRDGRSAT